MQCSLQCMTMGGSACEARTAPRTPVLTACSSALAFVFINTSLIIDIYHCNQI